MREAAKLYTELAPWWSLVTPPSDYAQEASFYRRALVDGCDRAPETVLELGSGGGNNASHLKAHFQMTLVDASPAMLAVSRALNPECDHLTGDMRNLRLNRRFDAVFVHDAVSYMASEGDLRRTFETAFVHCKPGGAALFAPDWTRESFRAGTYCGGRDDEARGLRYLEWVRSPHPESPTYTVDFAFLLRRGDEPLRVVHDRHECGLFSRAVWLDLLTEVGFRASALPFPLSDAGPSERRLEDGEPVEIGAEVFLGQRPIAG